MGCLIPRMSSGRRRPEGRTGTRPGYLGDPMDAQRQEYDRFGPWAIEISAEDPPPPLFVPYLTRPSQRCSASSCRGRSSDGMRVPAWTCTTTSICLYDDDLVVHQRVGREVRSDTCRYQDVQAPACDPASAVRQHPSRPARPHPATCRTARSRMTSCRASSTSSVSATADRTARSRWDRSPRSREGELSFLLRGTSGDEAAPPHRDVPPRRAGHDAGGSRGMPVARGLLFRIARKRLLESMHLTDGRELMIIDRGQPYAYRWQAVYGSDTCYIPIANLRGVVVAGGCEECGRQPGASRPAGAPASMSSPRTTPSIKSYAAFLSSLPDVARETNAA